MYGTYEVQNFLARVFFPDERRATISSNPLVGSENRLKVSGIQGTNFFLHCKLEEDIESRVTSTNCNSVLILPSLHNRTLSKVEAWACWSTRPKICLIVTIGLQQSG